MLEFMQRFDGSQPELPRPEKIAAYTELKLMTVHLLNKWLAKAAIDTTWETPRIRVLLEDRLDNHILRFETGRLIGKNIFYLYLQHVVLDLNGSKVSNIVHMYNSFDGREVRRIDGLDLAHTVSPYSPDFLDFISWVEEESPNRQLFRDMGFNNQPVSEHEIKAAHAAALFAEPIPDQSHSILHLSMGF